MSERQRKLFLFIYVAIVIIATFVLSYTFIEMRLSKELSLLIMAVFAIVMGLGARLFIKK